MAFRVGIDQECFHVCRSCNRCDDKGRYSKCWNCNGRVSPDREPHPDDSCRCSEGILQIKTRAGQFIQRRFMSNPFEGSVQTDAADSSERDWNSWLRDKQEELNDPNFNPVQWDNDES